MTRATLRSSSNENFKNSKKKVNSITWSIQNLVDSENFPKLVFNLSSWLVQISERKKKLKVYLSNHVIIRLHKKAPCNFFLSLILTFFLTRLIYGDASWSSSIQNSLSTTKEIFHCDMNTKYTSCIFIQMVKKFIF